MNYFDRPEISVSDLKAFLEKTKGGNPKPDNIQAIYSMGTLSHEIILEPYKVNKTVITPEIELATKMKDTFFRDPLCQMIVMRPDFKREEECYKEIEVGGFRYKARIKCDGISRGIKMVLEFKGLSVTTQKAFEAAIDNLMYDMAAVQYILVSECDTLIIVGISKIKPSLMFKKIIKKHDETYLWGEHKLITTLEELHKYSPEDVKLVS